MWEEIKKERNIPAIKRKQDEIHLCAHRKSIYSFVCLQLIIWQNIEIYIAKCMVSEKWNPCEMH